MGKNVNYKEIQDFAKKLEKQLSDANRDKFMEDCCKEIAARLLSRVIKRTPVKEGTLRRGWQIDDNKNINVVKRGGEYRCSIYNSVNYASYVEYGHRTPKHDGWVPGQFFLTISEKEVDALAPALLEKRLMELLKGAMG